MTDRLVDKIVAQRYGDGDRDETKDLPHISTAQVLKREDYDDDDAFNNAVADARDMGPNGQTVPVELPYDITPETLILDPSSKDRTTQAALSTLLAWLRGGDTGETERVLRGAVALFSAGAGTIGECLDTALVWERG